MILAGTLLTPTGELYKNAYVRLEARTTSQQVLKSTSSGFKTGDDGEYTFDCPFGTYSVVVSSQGTFQSIGVFSIDDETTETSINELLILGQTAISNPLVQQVRQDALSAGESADAATASEQAATSAADAAALSAEQAAQGSPYNLVTWSYTQAFQLVSATRDENGAIISANIVWPDGKLGIFTTDIASVDFPGAIDAWHATYVGTPTKTITQPSVTRDENGAVTIQPAITIV